MSISNKKFDRMSDVFDADFEPEDEDLEAGIPVRTREEIKQELAIQAEQTRDVVQYTENEVRITDQSYIQNEFRLGIEMLGDVAEVVRQDINQGTSGSKIESFASLMRERREHLNSLKDINLKVHELNNKPNEEPKNMAGVGVQNNMIFTSTDALDLILQARDGVHSLDPDKEIK